MSAAMVIAGALAAYLLGSIPTGLWLGLRLRGIDIRQHGSRNIGATNTLRVLGKKLGAIALAGDMLKGLVPVLLIAQLSNWPYAPLVCGVAAVLGHTASIFLKFHGGKGVATSAGVFLGLCPVPTLAALGVFAIIVAITRMVSAGSMLGAIAFTIMVYLMPHPLPVRIVATVAALLILIRHRTNLQRILHGAENRI